MHLPFTAFILTLILLGSTPGTRAAEPTAVQQLTPAQLRQDLNFLQDALAKKHPDIHFSADAAALATAMARVESQLVSPMTQDQAWQQFATLNPVFADAHVTVVSPDPRKQTESLFESGQGLFPFEVHVDAAGRVYVLSALGGSVTAHRGARIEKVNGVAIEEVTRALLDRTNGDTAAFRAINLSSRWWWFYWKVFGTPETFDITLRTDSAASTSTKLPASRSLPVWLADSDASNFDDVFRLWKLNDDVAVLTVNTFAWADKKQFYAFTRQVFARLKASQTKTLVIDIRKNGGGDDNMWKDGLLRYIAAKPYRHGSGFVLRVIEGRQRDGQKAGDLIEGQIQSWVQPSADAEDLRFSGRVYVLVGGATYSSAVLFANVVQDFGFGKLLGTGGYARARQSGGTQTYTLPNSQLRVVIPRFILDRPSGARDPELLTPDVPLHDNPLDGEQVWTTLRAVLQAD